MRKFLFFCQRKLISLSEKTYKINKNIALSLKKDDVLNTQRFVVPPIPNW
jgi:hypothetical protein